VSQQHSTALNENFAKRVARGEAPDYFKEARESGLFRVVPMTRTEGISTSNLIKRVLTADDDLGARKDGGPADNSME